MYHINMENNKLLRPLLNKGHLFLISSKKVSIIVHIYNIHIYIYYINIYLTKKNDIYFHFLNFSDDDEEFNRIINATLQPSTSNHGNKQQQATTLNTSTASGQKRVQISTNKRNGYYT